MTAIYLMWNNNGFALAADSNQTAAANNQTWVDSVEKIIPIAGHQVAFGASGNATLEGVEVNEIIRSWSKTLPVKHFSHFDDYVVDFLAYFGSVQFPHSGYEDNNRRDFMKKELEVLKEELADNSGDIELTREQWIESLKHNVWNLNIYGTHWDALINTQDFLETLSEVTLDKIERIENIRKRMVEKLPDDSRRMFMNQVFKKNLESHIVEPFPEVMGEEFDRSNDKHLVMAEILTINLENSFDFNAPIEFIFTGYGENDWVPSAVKLKVASRANGTPRIAIAQIATPLTDWYLSLAIDSGVNALVRGIGGYSRTRLMEIAGPHLKKDHQEPFEQALIDTGKQQFENAMGKIDSLTLSRLEYVARLFVQIEALQSYLNEPVPGVGGDTRIISMTKNTKSEKLIQEMP
jgi:hypothetical protein